MWVDAPRTGVRFPVPQGWKAVPFREVLDSGDEKAVAEAADIMGITAAELDSLADQVEVLVIGPTVERFAVNINAVPQPGVAMPSAQEARAQLKQLGGTIGTPVTGTTAFGRSLVVPYTLTAQGLTIQGRSILLETPDGLATLTVSHPSQAEADALTRAILADVAAL